MRRSMVLSFNLSNVACKISLGYFISSQIFIKNTLSKKRLRFRSHGQLAINLLTNAECARAGAARAAECGNNVTVILPPNYL